MSCPNTDTCLEDHIHYDSPANLALEATLTETMPKVTQCQVLLLLDATYAVGTFRFGGYELQSLRLTGI